MLRARFLISLLAVTLGLLIVGVSLFAVSPVMSTGGQLQASQLQFYVSDIILPDHVAYPALMIADRLELELASELDQHIELEVEYGLRRMEYARLLLAKDKPELAVTTLTKSQKYLIHAMQETLDHQVSYQQQEQLVKISARYCSEVKTLSAQLSDANRAEIDRLIVEIESLKTRLQESIS